MNGLTEFARRAESRVGESEPLEISTANGMRNAGAPEVLPRNDLECTALHRHWSRSPRGSQFGPQIGLGGEFMAVLSHELRNSLSAIRGATGILRMEISAGAAAVKARALIERQVSQMTRLVEDLLDVSRVRSGKLRLQCERVDLRTIAAHAAQTVEFTMQERTLRMTTSFGDAPVWLQADPLRLGQVLVNLLINAGKYTDAGGEVSLTVEQDEGEAVVRIRDTGIGIDRDLLPHVFDLFVQADPSSRRADAGLGIGLAVVRSLVECHGGHVSVTSAGPGRGSEFMVRLPNPTQRA
jgi:signal transduction histidine kinase